MPSVVLFTGQGAQKKGMARDFYERFDEVKALFSQADETLNFKLSELILNGPVEELKKTSNTQPAVLTVSYAIFKVLSRFMEPSRISFFAGHSLGEYTALCAAGVLDFPSALNLVRKRGELMEKVTGGGMAAVLGMEKDKIIEICAPLGAEAVNFNSPRQTVIAGKKESIDAAETALKNAGAKRVVKLEVSGPFHSSLMKDLQNDFAQILDSHAFGRARIPVVSNYDAKSHTDAEEIKKALKEQLAAPVLWTDSVNFMVRNGANLFIECGPAKVLSTLVAQISARTRAVSVYDLPSLEEAKKII